MGELIEIEAADGHRLAAYRARPAGTPRGGVVIAQDAFGMTDYLKSVCDTYAADGYLAVAPAVYDRQQRGVVFPYAGPAQQTLPLRRGLVWDDVVKDLAAAHAVAAEAGRVGIVGFCVGGSMAWQGVLNLPFAAASCYYGRDITGWLDRAPLPATILHFGTRDELIPIADVERVRAAFPHIATYLYEAGHAFDNALGTSYVAAAAAPARERTLALLRAHVG
jgi:carboxymethylenebutenolidase